MRKLELFFFKYFSEETKDDPKTKHVRWVFTWVWFAMLIASIIIYQFDLILGLIVAVSYTVTLLIFGLLWILVFFYHNWRIKNNKL